MPVSAIASAPDGATSVLAFEPSDGGATGTVHRRPVEIAPAADGQVMVTSTLAPGEEIVVAGVAGPEDGKSVRRFTGFPG